MKPATNASTECCSPGYTGLQCNVCQQDSVCNHVPVGDFGETGICQKKAKVWKNEHWLHCRISAPQLTPVFPGLTQISYVRNLTAGTGFVSAFYRGRETFYCETFACEQYVSGRNIVSIFSFLFFVSKIQLITKQIITYLVLGMCQYQV